MTTSAGAQFERALNFERQGEEVETTFAKDVFRVHGMVDALRDLLNSAKQAFAGMKNERGPGDYEDNERDIKELIFEAVRFGAQQGGYREAPKGRGNESAVIIGCTVAVISAFMLGAWQVSMRVTAVEVQVKNDSDRNREWQLSTDRRLDRLENRSP